MHKIGRNDSCFCGSKKKYKYCCLNSDQHNRTNYTQEIKHASQMTLQHDKKKIESAIATLKNILAKSNLPIDEQINSHHALITGYQHIGEHKNAITQLNNLIALGITDKNHEIHLMHKLAISLTSLGALEYACELFDKIDDRWSQNKEPDKLERRIRGVFLIEAGKAYSKNSNNEKAISCWERAINYLNEFQEIELEHIERAKANIAFLKLKSENDEEQNAGIETLEASSRLKLKIGDIQGLANNYCNLGNYFRSKKRYGRAISYYRKDLYLSRLVGNKRDIASTLGNFATLYAELKQFKPARKMLKEAEGIARELDDQFLLKISEKQLNFINIEAKNSAINNIGIGDKAFCGCNSNKLYSDCCGQADFEPVNIPQIYGGISEDAKKIHEEISSVGKSISPLDFILRNIPASQLRKSWTEHHVHDGWISIKELPDMASLHLISAREMAEKSIIDNNLSCALSAIILSVCSLEAFINQLSFFIYENKEHQEMKNISIPPDLLESDAFTYQRTVNLELKWQQISDCINGADWLKKTTEWAQIKDLIHIRNELVHFKTNGYEQIVPPPKKKDVIYSKIPKSVDIRDEPHSWPFKILTSSLAMWATNTAESLIFQLKKTYNDTRRYSET